MIEISKVRQLALSLPEVEEHDHFGRPSFRIKRKIFATIHPVEKRVVLKLSVIDQSVFTDYNSKVFYPVKGAWGKQGWTMVELMKVRKDMFMDVLTTAWREVAPKSILSKNLETTTRANAK